MHLFARGDAKNPRAHEFLQFEAFELPARFRRDLLEDKDATRPELLKTYAQKRIPLRFGDKIQNIDERHRIEAALPDLFETGVTKLDARSAAHARSG